MITKFLNLTSLIIVSSNALFSQTINVSTASELQAALNAATPGQTIVLADGTYTQSAGFYVNAGINGTASKPITLKGTSKAILSTGTVNNSYGFYLKGNNYWVLDGFTVRNSKKGVMLDNSHYNKIQNLRVTYIGDEGIHLRTYSSNNLVDACFVDSMGIVSGASGTAEGIYVGSAKSNWVTYTGGNPDTCNYNVVSNNSFGDNIPSENIDIKEGTSYGKVSNNTFNGKGLNGVNSGDSWIDVKGNYYAIECNTGSNTLTDGFQTHIQLSGWGDFNTFSNNSATGTVAYLINIQTSGSQGTANGNKVCSNNTAAGNTKGISNVTTQSCTGTCQPTNTVFSSPKNFNIYPNPASTHIYLTGLDSMHDYIIINTQGKVVLSGKTTSAISIENLPNGIYVVYIPSLNINCKFSKI